MKVEIHNTGGGANSLLLCYEVRRTPKNSNQTTGRPYCSIREEDFFNLLPEKEYEKAQEGKIHFEVGRELLLNACKTIF